VILLDGLNTAFRDQAYARQQLIKFLHELQPGDYVALYQLGSSLRILYDFTNDAGPCWPVSKRPAPEAARNWWNRSQKILTVARTNSICF